ncbi:protein kinase domain-containing protein [Oscillatoria acuminata]|uniref:non-specific serine/threonine protein kinase n=1 Tax=Oscillatoria acuminata PCC 6304 TaxID=56110 RepID=K9TPR7_9CYAN|nr:protein kinase [Oscillatoria acuminata]AFY84388.1 serine/threonine protein kinase [Oscillatoria acuminata PCC 6304]
MTIEVGKTLAGHYQIIKSLSSGGFGETYIAEDTHRPGNPQCVLKHLKPANSSQQGLAIARRLFNSEAQVLEKLGEHSQIPRLFAYFEENQEFYLVQEFIEGHPLSAELPLGQRWSETQVKTMLEDVLSILEFVHNQGVIHRDIKPDNIMRRESDHKLVLIDFGAIKEVGNQGIPQTGQVSGTVAIGTPGYMPTEQGRGKPRPNSDLYALGMIAIQALTGMLPNQLREDNDTGEISWQDQAEVSPALTVVLSQMIRYHFKDRYKTATEVLTALQSLGSGGTYQPTEVANPTYQPTAVANSQTYQPSHETANQGPMAAPTPPVSKPSLPSEPSLPAQPTSPEAKGQNKTPMLIGAMILTLLVFGGGGFLYVQAENAQQQEIAAERQREAQEQRQREAQEQRQREAQEREQNQLGEQKLAQAKKEAEESGNLQAAIALAKEVPVDSDSYQNAQTAINKWEEVWQTYQNIFAQVEAAYNAGRWQEVENVARQLPQNPYWNPKVDPMYYEAKAQLKAIQAAEATKYFCVCNAPGNIRYDPSVLPSTNSPTNISGSSCSGSLTNYGARGERGDDWHFTGTWSCDNQ